MSTSCSLRLISVENCALCSRGRLRSTSAVSPSGLFFPAVSLFSAWTKFVASKPTVSTLVSFSLEFSQLLIAAAASFCVSLQPAEVLKVFCQHARWSDFLPLQQFVQSHAQTWSWARSCSAVLLCFVSVFSLQLLFSSVCVFSRSVCSFFCVLVSSVPFLSVCASGSRVLCALHFSCLSCMAALFLLHFL